MVFVYLRKIQSLDFLHHFPTTNWHKIHSVNTVKVIGLNLSSNCACAALNWVRRSVADCSSVPQVHFVWKHLVRKQTISKSVNMHLMVFFAFWKLRWLLHNTADRTETVFGHLKLEGEGYYGSLPRYQGNSFSKIFMSRLTVVSPFH